jgi:hypothetical protein
MANPKKAPVTVRALLQRINRKIQGDHEKVMVARGTQARQYLGEYYLFDIQKEEIKAKKINNLEVYAREIGVLQDWEEMVPNG